MWCRRVLSSCAFLGLFACADDPVKQQPSSPTADMNIAADMAQRADMASPADQPADMPSADAGQDMSASACSAQTPQQCRYSPVVDVELLPEAQRIFSRELTYQDVTGQPRRIRFEVRRPRAGASPAPVIIWSHGGSSGRDDPMNVGVEWGEVFNRAGYMSVHIAHAQRDAAQSVALCQAIGVEGCEVSCAADAECTRYEGGICQPNDKQCRYFKEPGWDRPEDLAQVISWLEENAAAGRPLEGLINLEKLAYAGHSAGAGAAMMANGAVRAFADKPYLKLEPRVSAFLSFSPQGPTEDGFAPASFDGTWCAQLAADPASCFSRPHLVITGMGDDTNDSVAEERRASFEALPTGLKFMGWVKDEAARHGTFDHNPETCLRYAKQEELDEVHYMKRCPEILTWIEAATLAFLDANLRDSAPARAYLRSQAPALLSRGQMDWVER